MKKKTRLGILSIGFIIILLLGASIIWDIVILILGTRINQTFQFIIVVISVWILIELMFRMRPFNELNKRINKRFFKKKK